MGAYLQLLIVFFGLNEILAIWTYFVPVERYDPLKVI